MARVRKVDYRSAYIKKNPGIFGFLYFCAYCWKPITRKSMQVDHIMPHSKYGSNRSWNLVASCSKCNQKKSNKIDHRLVVGYVTKIITLLIYIPFMILSGIFLILSKLNNKLKLIIIGGALVYYYFWIK